MKIIMMLLQALVFKQNIPKVWLNMVLLGSITANFTNYKN